MSMEEEEEEEEEGEGITRRRTKPALRCSPTSPRTHRSARIRRAENHEKETRASLGRTRAEPSPKSRLPQVKFRLLVSSIGPSDDDNHVMGKKVVRRDGNVSRRGMSFPSVPLTLPLEPLTWCPPSFS